MNRYVVSPLAQDDIEAIALYIALDSPARSDRLIDRLHEKFVSISRFPGQGRPRDDLLAGVRASLMGQYMIFYRGPKNAVEILRVYHTKRDAGGLKVV